MFEGFFKRKEAAERTPSVLSDEQIAAVQNHLRDFSEIEVSDSIEDAVVIDTDGSVVFSLGDTVSPARHGALLEELRLDILPEHLYPQIVGNELVIGALETSSEA